MNALLTRRHGGKPQAQIYRGLVVSVVFVFCLSFLFAVDPASANQVFLDEGGAGTIFGPGRVIYISGDIDVVEGCRDPNKDDGWPNSLFPIADIYAVPNGVVIDSGDQILVGKKIEVMSMLIGGQFISEPLGVTGLGGDLEPAKYDIVLDECQDGRYDPPVDFLLGEGAGYAFIVIVDTTVPPTLPVIALELRERYKQEACLEWKSNRKRCSFWHKSYDLVDQTSRAATVATCLASGSGYTFMSFMTSAAAECELALRMECYSFLVFQIWRVILNSTLCAVAEYYERTCLHPVDYSYEDFAKLSIISVNESVNSRGMSDVYPFLAKANSNYERTVLELANRAGEAGVIDDALTTSWEKYEGAVNVTDVHYQYLQAQDIAKFSTMMIGIFTEQRDLLTMQKTELANLDLTLYYNAERAGSVQDRLAATGFDYPEILELKRVGFSDEQIDSLHNWIVNWDLPDSNLTEKELIDDRIVALDSFIVDLQALAENASAVADSLLPLIDLNHPTADPGGPYSGNEGSPIAFDGSGSSDPNGDPLIYEWDFDLDGEFDDAIGVTASWTWNRECKLLVGLKVTDPDDNCDYAWTRVTVLDVNRPPVIIDFSPWDSVTIGIPPSVPTTFSVTVSDPDGDLLTYSWVLDSIEVSTDQEWTFTPDSASKQIHELRVIVSDGSPLSPDAEERCLFKVNTPPSITSAPILTAAEGVEYAYDVEATDLEDDLLLYSLETFPEGMTMVDSSGLITWVPTSEQVGLTEVIVKVDDFFGGIDTQSFNITVSGINQSPEITSTAETTAVVGVLYTYGVEASDPDGDTLTFSLVTYPDGMTIVDSTGFINWIPVINQVGANFVSVRVEDGRGGVDTQDFSITVAPPPADTIPPVVTVEVQPKTIYTEETVHIAVTATDNTVVASVDLTVKGQSILLSDSLTADYVALDVGAYGVQATAYDTAGNRGNAYAWFSALEPPMAKDLVITSVNPGESNTDPHTLEISGTIEVQIRNNGVEDISHEFSIVVFEDSNMTGSFEPPQDNILGGDVYQGGLLAGGTALVAINVSGTVIFRGNLIWAIVDSENDVPEDDETNNLGNSGQLCEYHPPVGEFSPGLEWEWTSWHVMCMPVVGNLNDDNGDGLVDEDDIPDVIFSSFTSWYTRPGVLHALSGNSGMVLFEVSDPLYAPNPTNPIALGDIDGDNLPEIITTRAGGHGMIAFENDGTFKWTSSQPIGNPGYNWGGASLADLDHDGNPEIIIGRTVLNNDGSLRWEATKGSGYNWYFWLSCVADLDLDGNPEVVTGNTAYRADGSIYWRSGQDDGFPAIGDFDDDLFPEIVVVTYGTVRLQEHDGQIKWGPFDLPHSGLGYNIGGAPTIADFDADGEPEIGVAGATYYSVFETDGSIKWTSETKDYSSGATGSSVFDFDGDGSAEVVYNDEHYMRIYRGTDGLVLFELENSSGTALEYPLIVDVDNDNNAEIVLCANDYAWGEQRGIKVFGDAADNWVNTRNIWNQHTYHITNVNDDATIPRHELNNWQVYNNYRQNDQPEISVLASPDLTASKLSAEEIYGTDSLRISVRVGNGGALGVVAGVPVSFYNDWPDSAGMLIATANTSMKLGPGEYQDIWIDWKPSVVDPVIICAVVDDNGSGTGIVSECNEENNQTCATIMLKCYGEISGIVWSDLQLFPGILVDLFDSTMTLIGVTSTDDSGYYCFDSLLAGHYAVSIVTPLGFTADEETKSTEVLCNEESEVNFYLTELPIVPSQRTIGYWKHQVNVHLSGRGHAQESLADMSHYMSLIREHFNNNFINPIIIFEVPQPANQTDSLEVLQGLLTVNVDGTMNDRAKQQLIALMLNVVSLKLDQATPISEDSASVSQAITYCSQLITDSDSSNDEIAKDIADQINNGILVASQIIPLTTPNIVYKGAEDQIAETSNLPDEFSLLQNYPNPFNPICEIQYALPADCHVTLIIYNILGQKVKTLVDEHQNAGLKTVHWDGKDDDSKQVASGVYLYKIKAGEFVQSKKMLLLK